MGCCWLLSWGLYAGLAWSRVHCFYQGPDRKGGREVGRVLRLCRTSTEAPGCRLLLAEPQYAADTTVKKCFINILFLLPSWNVPSLFLLRP